VNNLSILGFGEADPSVLYRNMQKALFVFFHRIPKCAGNRPFQGEFQRIANQVDHYLFETFAIGIYKLGHLILRKDKMQLDFA